MSLKMFHIFFIMIAALTSLIFGIWASAQYSQNQQIAFLMAALFSFVVVIGLLVYEYFFIKKSKSVLLFLALICSFSSKPAFACSMCFFGDKSSLANVALRGGVLTLLLILLGVLGAFTKFFINFNKRAKATTQS